MGVYEIHKNSNNENNKTNGNKINADTVMYRNNCKHHSPEVWLVKSL